MASAKPVGKKDPAKEAPKTETKNAPKNDAKKPADKKATKDAPKETKAAVKNAFGDVPKKDDAKQPANEAKNNDAPKQSGNDAKQNDAPAKEPENGAKAPENAPKDAPADAPKDAPADAPKDANPPADGNPPADQQVKEPAGGDNKLTVTVGVNPPQQNNLVINDTPPGDGNAAPPADGKTAPPADGKTAPAPADGKTAPTPADGKTAPAPADGKTAPAPADGKTAPAPADGKTAPAPADGKTAPAPADGKTAPAPADGKTAPAPADGKTAPAPADGKTAPAPADGKTAPAPADGKTVPAPADGKTAPAAEQPIILTTPIDVPKSAIVYDPNQQPANATPLVDPKSPNAALPPPAAPAADPKASDNPDANTVVDPEVDKALNTKLSNGKTVAEEANAKTMEEMQKHSDEQAKNKQAPDAVSRYYRYKMAEAAAKGGIPTGPYPDAPTVPAQNKDPGEVTANTIFDPKKIAEGVKAGENDPEVIGFLASKQKENVDKVLEEKIASGEMGDVPKDPVTGSRADYLAGKQIDIVNDPKTAEAIAKMPPDKQQEAIAKTIAPFGQLGFTPKDTKGQLVNVINKVADITGQPKPVVDANNDFVKTPNGESVVTDRDSGKNVAIGTDGKVVTEKTTGLPYVYRNDGKAESIYEAGENAVLLDKSGNAIFLNKVTGDRQLVNSNVGGDRRMFNPDTNNPVIIDPKTGAVVERDKVSGEIVKDPQTGYARINDPATGKALSNPATGNAIVADPNAKAAVEVDYATGKVVADQEGNPVIVNPKTGYQVWDSAGNAVVADKASGLPVINDPKLGVKVIMNPKTAAPMLDPAKGVTAILDPETKAPIAALLDKNSGQLLKNPNGQIAQIDEDSGLPVVVDAKTGVRTIVNPNDGYAVQDPKGNTLVVDDSTGFAVAKTPDGKDVVETNTGAKLIYDPKTGLPIGKPQFGAYTVIDPKTKIPVEVDPFGKYTVEQASGNKAVMDPASGQNKTAEDGTLITIDAKSNNTVANVDGKNMVVDPESGKYVTEKNSGAKVMVDPDTSLPVYIDPTTNAIYKDPNTGGTPVVDANSGDPLMDINGNVVQINPETGQAAPFNKETGKFDATAPAPIPLTTPDGKQVTDANGNLVAKDGATGNNVALDPATKLPINEPASGRPQIVDDLGNPVKTADGKNIVIDKDTGNPVAVDADGKTLTDPKGNAKVYYGDGTQVTDANGNPVVLDQNSNAPILTDKASGEPLKEPKSGLVYVANTQTGGAVVDPATGNVVVLDQESKAPVLAGPDGKVVQDENGNAVMANIANGKAALDNNLNQIVIDKNIGMPVVVDPATKVAILVDGNGDQIVDPKTGGTFQINPGSGIPVLVKEDLNGFKLVMDPEAGGPAKDPNGNLVYIDDATGQQVVNDPQNGVTDVITGKAPVAAAPGGMTPNEIVKLVRNSIGSVYWNTYGVALSLGKTAAAGTILDPKVSPFFKGTQNFHASRMVSSATGIVTMVMAGVRWAAGTKDGEALRNGDQKAILSFASDMSSIMKSLGFYSKTVDGFVKYFTTPKIGGAPIPIKQAPDGTFYTNSVAGAGNPPAGQVWGKNAIYVPKNTINPVTGQFMAKGGFQDIPPQSFDPKVGVVKTPVGPQIPGGMVRLNPLDGSWERFNANAGKFEPLGKPSSYYELPNYDAKFKPTANPATYKDFAANRLTKLIGKTARFLTGTGNFVGGGLQVYQGIDKLIKADGNAAKVASGAFDIIGGAAFMGAGIFGLGSALGATGAFATAAGLLTGPLLAIGLTATVIVAIIDVANAPTKPEKWAQGFTNQFDGVNVFNGNTEETEKQLEAWYNQYALTYWSQKEAEEFGLKQPNPDGPAKFGPKWGGNR